MIILEVYVFIVLFVLFITAVASFHNEQPKEINCFYTWLFYGLLFPLPFIKGLFKFIYNLFKN